MTIPIIALIVSVIAAAAAIASVVVSWKIPMLLREEKFKEIFYGRRFAIYDQILSQIPALFYFFAAVQHSKSDVDRLLQKKELLDRIFKFKMTLEGASHFLPEQLQMTCTRIYQNLQTNMENTAPEKPMDGLLEWFEAINIVRADQGMEKLAKSITEMIGKGYYPKTYGSFVDKK